MAKKKAKTVDTGVSIGDAIKAELQEWLETVQDNGREFAQQSIEDIAEFTQSMVLDSSPENVRRQRRNMAHVMNSLKNHVVMEQFGAMHRLKTVSASVITRVMNSALTALTVV